MKNFLWSASAFFFPLYSFQNEIWAFSFEITFFFKKEADEKRTKVKQNSQLKKSNFQVIYAQLFQSDSILFPILTDIEQNTHSF